MSHKDYIKNLINLQDNTLEITDVDLVDEDNIKYFNISIVRNKQFLPKCCKYCGSISIISHGSTSRKIKYLPFANISSNIIYTQKRFLCKDCGKTFNDECSIVCKNGTISNAVKNSILEEFKSKQSSSDIATKNDVSITTANDLFINNTLENRKPLSYIICIDEFKASTIAGEYALIIGDPRTGDIIDILPSRRQDYIYYYFQKIPDSERFSVKYVVTDLFDSYRTIVRNLFWKSIHIADRFHWIRLATKAFDNLRINTMKMYKKIADENKNSDYNNYYEITKKYHKILIANKYKKEIWYFDQTVKVTQLKKNMSYQEIIEYIINFDKSIEEGYNLLQDLYKIAKQTPYNEAEQAILRWCDQVSNSEYKLKEFKSVVLTYKSWIKEITNSFLFDPVTKKRITNGFIEGKNNFCKVIKRVGFGYKNFDLFRARVLYISNNKKDKNNEKIK